MAQITLPHNYNPRSYHKRIYAALDAGYKHVMALIHRRGGKTESAIAYVPSPMMQRQGNYAHIFPKRNTGKEVVFEGIGANGRFVDHFPRELLHKQINMSDLKITLKNIRGESGSTYQVYGTDANANITVASNLCGIIWDEYSLQDPMARALARPILAENGGWELFTFTPRGENHAYQLFEYAKRSTDWYVEYLTVEDTRRDGAGEDGSPIVTQEAIQAHYNELVAEGFPDPEAFIQQEYYLSWKAPTPGAYWGKELRELEQDGRIGTVLYDPSRPMDTYWDLGISKAHDTNTCWFVQYVGNSLMIVDYHQASNEGAKYFVEMLRGKGYAYRRHYTKQSDLDTADWGTGKTRLETLREFGIEFHGVPDLPLVEGINAVRAILPRCYFSNAPDVGVGLAALRAYHRLWDSKRKVFLDHPEHDYASHPADAFRYLAVGSATGWEGDKAVPRRRPRPQQEVYSWMN